MFVCVCVCYILLLVLSGIVPAMVWRCSGLAGPCTSTSRVSQENELLSANSVSCRNLFFNNNLFYVHVSVTLYVYWHLRGSNVHWLWVQFHCRCLNHATCLHTHTHTHTHTRDTVHRSVSPDQWWPGQLPPPSPLLCRHALLHCPCQQASWPSQSWLLLFAGGLDVS